MKVELHMHVRILVQQHVSRFVLDVEHILLHGQITKLTYYWLLVKLSYCALYVITCTGNSYLLCAEPK